MTGALGLIDRYQNYRVRRWLVQEQRTVGMLTGWRSQRRRRLLVPAVGIALPGIAAAGVLRALDLRAAPLVALVALLLFLPSWTMLRIASSGQDHAPTRCSTNWRSPTATRPGPRAWPSPNP
ncbi:hypothetical protein [Nocardia sp. NPDC050718]|uniref:hypothetical protein n=1 Tax=Nocardia sp. NPDC050718 TaxID=3155788 RepID=UPI0033F758CA